MGDALVDITNFVDVTDEALTTVHGSGMSQNGGPVYKIYQGSFRVNFSYSHVNLGSLNFKHQFCSHPILCREKNNHSSSFHFISFHSIPHLFMDFVHFRALRFQHWTSQVPLTLMHAFFLLIVFKQLFNNLVPWGG